jgi:hypothetical protein
VEEGDTSRPALHEVLVVWSLVVLVGLAVLVTYARLPPERLYHVSESGVRGGVGRALVFAGYPVALVTIAIVAVVASRLRRTWAWVAAAAAVVLCATVAWPGVVDQDDLDAKPANALAGVGVLVALTLTAVAWAREGLGRPRPLGPLDAARAAFAIVLLAAALPWIAADLGSSLGGPFLGAETVPEPGDPDQIAVHLGHHHGLDGTLLALAALALSRAVQRVGPSAVRVALGFYVALMVVYGLANALQDFWLEQLVKRGTISAELPSMIHPKLSPAWGAMIGVALVIHLAVSRVQTVQQAKREAYR